MAAPESFFAAALGRWIDRMTGRPAWVLALCAISVAASLAYTARNLGMNSEMTHMVDPSVPYRADYDAYKAAFPQLVNTIVVVVTGADPPSTREAAAALAASLRSRPDLYGVVYYPGGDEFFAERGLLYLDTDQLEDFADGLARAEPALATVVQDPSLRGLLDAMGLAIDGLAHGEVSSAAVATLLDEVRAVVDAERTGTPGGLAWTDVMMGDHEPGTREILVVQPVLDFTDALSGRAAIDGIRQASHVLGYDDDSGISVRLTGRVPLSNDEMTSAQEGTRLAGIVSVLAISVILTLGVRSAWMVGAVMVTLFVGLAWSAAFATLSVGRLNMISVAFAVLFIGLGVDLAIHFVLRYREEALLGRTRREAARRAGTGVGGALLLCATTTSIGFLSFTPTDYRGLAELGLISGGSMYMALLASFTVLPALLAVIPAPTQPIRTRRLPRLRLTAALSRYDRRIVVASAALAVIAAAVAARGEFDFSTLGLKDPNTESFTTLRELHENGIATFYAISAMAPDLSSAEDMARKVEKLDVVASATTLRDYVPRDQADKLEIIETMTWFLEPVLHPWKRRDPPDAAERLSAIEHFRTEVDDVDPAFRATPIARSARALAESLEQLVEASPQPDEAVAALERRLLGNFEPRVEDLRTALRARPTALEDLPDALRAREIAPDGRARVTVVPSEDISQLASLRRFVREVSAVLPNATGRPVVEAGMGNVVVGALTEAGIIALAAIALILFGSLRSLVEPLLVLLPLGLAGLFTAATGVLVGIPFNLANVIVLPLLLGLGVDNGIHLVLRRREVSSVGRVFDSSTPRAVTLSGLTTISAFGSLALSSHRGIASMGVLLTLAVIYLLVCTTILLPALMSWRDRRRASDGSAPREPMLT